MKLEAVIVCVNYSDFLIHTLPQNKQHFDKVVVVTDMHDKETKNVCEYHHVECIQTNVFYNNGDNFNKGKGINEGLKRLGMDGWVVQLDADIYLPPLTRMILNNCEKNGGFNVKSIYGIDRMMCPDYNSWIDFMENPKLTHEGWVYVHTNIFPLGVRIAKFHTSESETGYLPIGFFQMWNPRASNVYRYPEHHGSADRTDVKMAHNFTKFNRHLIPEIISIHLESESLGISEMGKNWDGRKTQKFARVQNSVVNKGFIMNKDSVSRVISKNY
jgi:GTP:adenosylcobinamide-phosphate guanylyltransferase